MKTSLTKKLVLTALFLALGLVLPFVTGEIPQIGSMFLPMHLPVLICGFVCGWPYGVAAGFITPLLRSVLFGMPPIYPTAAAMVFELSAYGFAAGFFYKLFPKRTSFIYAALILSMIFGRAIWGIAMAIISGASGSTFTWAAFMSGAFLNAIPGIVVQIIIIPMIIITFKKTRLIENDRYNRV